MEVAEHRNHTTGMTLKLARVAQGVSQRAIAQRLGVSPQRISGIEASYRPTDAACARYLGALDELTRGVRVAEEPAATPVAASRRTVPAPTS